MGFAIAPREATQGNVQRIMYLHVPSVWVAYLAFGVVLVASVVYLMRRAEAADRLRHAPAQVGGPFPGLPLPPRACSGEPPGGALYDAGHHRGSAPGELRGVHAALCVLRRQARPRAAPRGGGGRVTAGNWGFVVAAYGLAAVVLIAYWRFLVRREKELQGQGSG